MDEDALLGVQSGVDTSRLSFASDSSASTTSLVFDRIDERLASERLSRPSDQKRSNGSPYAEREDLSDFDDEDPLKEGDSNDLETGPFLGRGAEAVTGGKRMDRGLRRLLIIISALLIASWIVGLILYISARSYQHSSARAHDPQATITRGNGKKITLEQIQDGYWYAESREIKWIAGPNGEDGLLLETGGSGKDYLVVEDVRAMNEELSPNTQLHRSRTLVQSSTFSYDGKMHVPWSVVPNKDHTKVLVATEKKSNWRYSTTAVYWILDVASQQIEPLIPGESDARVQLAQWSPTNDMIAFTRDNNLYLRRIASSQVIPITKDGGAELFYGVPDWVYEEEVIGGPSATWWSGDGKFIAFLRTNETGVPDYPIQYFIGRPSGTKPRPGEENYPEVRQIKYPKAGAHNPVVDIQFYDVARGDVFSVDISGDFADDDRLITTVLWAGGQVLIKETNRVSDVLRVVLVDVGSRAGKAVRKVDVNKIDGGWFEISQKTKYIPADPANNRPHDGYIDTVIYGDNDHLAYFTPLDNPDPVMLTSGDWEVVEAPSAVDLTNNVVYFLGTKDGSTQRHVYRVKLDGTGLLPYTNTTAEGYYEASFSSGAGYALINYRGPDIPWQRVLSTPYNKDGYEYVLENNTDLAEKARKHELPILKYGTLDVDGVKLNYVERRPPHFDERKKYPVLFYQYSGPGSQTVDKTFKVNFQSFVAAYNGYICVSVDGRGTGLIGRKNRVLVRGNLGHWEAHDQIAAAKHWAGLKYVDASRIAIWGWSYGGYTTLKTLEQDAGQTFSYGMAVAPVTDWRFYDSIYTERYMRTPQTNPQGYSQSAIENATALAQNKRFLIMHGIADDNVHMQNSLTLLDKLDLARVENYDVHVFPDSDHSIYYHNANRIVYDSKSYAPSGGACCLAANFPPLFRAKQLAG